MDACYGYTKVNKLFSNTETVCVKKLYNYIDSMLLVLRNIDLPLKVRRRKHHRNFKENLKYLGRSIDERPDEIISRNEFGHGDIYTVIGEKSKNDNVALTLLERLTRKYKHFAVSAVMQSLQKYYRDKFSQLLKTITSDNGSEFTELAELENNTTTEVYFAHPYNSWERGSNEHHNDLLRKLIPNGKKIDKYPSDDILFTAD